MSKHRDYPTIAEVCEFVVAEAEVHGRKFSPLVHTQFEDVALGMALAPGPFPIWHILAAQRATGRLTVNTPIEKAVEVSLMHDILGLQRVSV